MAAINGNVEIARAYRKKYGPEMQTAKLARIMYNENKLSFDSVENARYMLRYIEGKAGKKHKKRVDKTEFFMSENRSSNPYVLPVSDEIPYEPFIIPERKLLVFSDVHLPYHNIPSLTAAFDYGKSVNPDAIVLNGDIIDAHQLSRFIRDPKKRSFAQELNTLQEFIFSIRKAFPKAKLYYKIGNHEERYDAFLFSKAHELSDVEEFRLENIIRKRAGEIEIIGDRRIMKAGKLNIIHGHEFGSMMHSPVNVARGLFLRAKVSCMQGDRHQTSEHTETDMNGGITTTWSVACLCELHPYYARLNKWNNGCASIEIYKDGSFDVENKRIHNGKVL